MKIKFMSCIRSLMVVFSAIAIISFIPVQAATQWALLIGIDEYKSAQVPNLSGCVNDVELVKGDLVGKFGFPEDNIRILTNSAATHGGIVNAIRTHLVANAQPGDIVLLHFSGHGSQMRDAPGGDEIDDWDETLVPYDGRTEGVFDISDDQINGLLKELTAKTDHVVFWLDSCHSGSAARGGAAVRKIERDKRAPPPAPDYALSVRGAEGDGNIRARGSKYVLISGCLPHELSNEAVYGGRSHGALTWFLHEALMTAKDGATYRSVFDSAASAVKRDFASQTAQIEGLGQNVVLFGSRKISPRVTVPITSVNATEVRLGAGKAQMVGKGSLLEVYPPGTADYAATEPNAVLMVTASRDFEAKAKVMRGGPVEEQDQAVLTKTVYSSEPIATYVTPQALGVLPELEQLASDIAILDRLGDGERGGARLIVDYMDGYIVIQGGDKLAKFPPVSVSGPNLSARVGEQLQSVAHWLAVLGLKNLAGGIDVDIRLRRLGDQVSVPTPERVTPGNRGMSRAELTAHTLQVRIRNNEKFPIYPYVLDVSSDGSVTLLFPNEGRSSEALPARTVKDLVSIIPTLPVGHAAVTDTFKLIATATPIDPRVFHQGAVRSITEQRYQPTDDPLANFMAEAFRGQRSTFVSSPVSWGTAQRTIEITNSGLRNSGFAIHFDGPVKQLDSMPGARGGGAFFNGMAAVKVDDEGREWKLMQATSRGGSVEPVRSIGALFNEAYAIQDRIRGATRVEPLLEVSMPQSELLVMDASAAVARGGGDDAPDPEARADDSWSLKMIRAADAWQRLRDERGAMKGLEARGVVIAHVDTGYRRHPEVWKKHHGERPIDPAKGYDYYEDDADPWDPLLDSRKLDNPGHATVSGSVIVSPPGCQIDDPDGCVTGVAPGAQLIPMRVHRTVAQVNTSNMARAIRDVASNKIDGTPRVVSIAMGGPPSLSLYRAVKAAEKNGVLVVAAAGNNVGMTVWPARFKSTIAVAAVNVRCRPWSGSSYGNNVDISAPGEGVWRASMFQARGSTIGPQGASVRSSGSSEKPVYDIWLGEGTTYATGHTSGAAALWVAYHQHDPAFLRLVRDGQLTKAFRRSLTTSAWQPSADKSLNPPGTHCNTSDWNADDYGSGILDVASLLAEPLEQLAGDYSGSERLPLFGSLYPPGTSAAKIESDFAGLFGILRGNGATEMASHRFETEIMLHYTLDENVRRSISGLVESPQELDPYTAVKATLKGRDLSDRLRKALNN